MAPSTVTNTLVENSSICEVSSAERPADFGYVTDAGGFERLRGEWDSLLSRDPNATIFQTWEWLYTWWRHFGRGKKPVILVISDPGTQQPRAIAPMMLKPYVLPCLRELAFIGVGVSDYLGVICQSDRRSAVDSVFTHLQDNLNSWDVVDLGQIPPGDAIHYTNQTSELGASSLIAEILDHELCPVVSLAGSWEEYRRSLGKSLRFNIGYYERSLSKLYQMEIGVADESNLDSELESLFRLHTQRWRTRRLPGVLSGSSVRQFHKDVACEFLERGWLRLYYLKLDGVTRAALYCFAFKDTVYYYLGGFDPAFAKYGLGTILTAYAIRQAIEGGFSEFDMLRGSEDYKRRWRPDGRMNRRLLIHKPGVRSHSAHLLHLLEGHIERRFKDYTLHSKREKT